MISIYVLQCNINQLIPSNDILIKLQILYVKTYQFKTYCKGDSHSSKTANIILPGLMIKQR